jgi:6-phosphofructokinase 1
VVALPESKTDVAQIVHHLHVLKARGKRSIMIVVAEGDELGGAAVLNDGLNKAGCPFQTRVVTLGHLQRGGSPVPADRILASRLGDFAVRALIGGETGAMAGEVGGKLVLTPFPDTYASHKPVPGELLELLKTLAN